MRFEVLAPESAPVVRLLLEPGEVARVGAGRVITLSDGLELEENTRKLGHSLLRVLAKGKAHRLEIRAQLGAGEATLAPANHGEVTSIPVRRTPMLVWSHCVLLCDDSIDVAGGINTRGLATPHGSSLIRLAGPGLALGSPCGALRVQELAVGEILLVSSEFLMGFSVGMDYRVKWSQPKAPRGMLPLQWVQFQGPGILLLQSRSMRAAGSVVAF
jgi:uncharacterized protein (AIM24 family)